MIWLVIAALVLAAIVVAVLIFFCLKKKKRKDESISEKSEKIESVHVSSVSLPLPTPTEKEDTVLSMDETQCDNRQYTTSKNKGKRNSGVSKSFDPTSPGRTEKSRPMESSGRSQKRRMATESGRISESSEAESCPSRRGCRRQNDSSVSTNTPKRNSIKIKYRETCLMFEAPPTYDESNAPRRKETTRIVPVCLPSDSSLVSSTTRDEFCPSAGQTPRHQTRPRTVEPSIPNPASPKFLAPESDKSEVLFIPIDNTPPSATEPKKAESTPAIVAKKSSSHLETAKSSPEKPIAKVGSASKVAGSVPSLTMSAMPSEDPAKMKNGANLCDWHGVMNNDSHVICDQGACTVVPGATITAVPSNEGIPKVATPTAAYSDMPSKTTTAKLQSTNSEAPTENTSKTQKTQNTNTTTTTTQVELNSDAFSSTGTTTSSLLAPGGTRSSTRISVNDIDAGHTPQVGSPVGSDASKMMTFTPSSDGSKTQ